MLPADFATLMPNQPSTSLETTPSFNPYGPTSLIKPYPMVLTAIMHLASLKRWPPINTPHPSLTSPSVSSSPWLCGPFGRREINWSWKVFDLTKIKSLNVSPPPLLTYFSPSLPPGATPLKPLISLARSLLPRDSSS